MSTSLIAVVITLAALGSMRLALSRRTERAFEIVESRRRRGSGSGLFVLLGVGLCAGVLYGGYRWLPAGQPDLTVAQAEARPSLRLAETFDSYRDMQQNAQQSR
jgi:hypothetical protein